MLILNPRVIKTILEKGLKLDKTIQEIEKASQKYDADVNYININLKDENNIYCWLINHDKKTNNYFYLNNGQAETLPAYKETNYKVLLSGLIYSKIQLQKKHFLSRQKPLTDYYFKELKDNKPLTLLNAKNKDFISFVAFGSYSKINEFDITDDKKEIKKDFFRISNNYWDVKTIRKEAIKIYAVYNKDYKNYLLRVADADAKRTAREQIKSDLKAFEKYSYNDESFKKLQNNYTSLCLHCFSYNSLTDHRWDNCESAYIEFNGVVFNPNAKTRQEVFNYMIDKSGYFALLNRYNLLQRAEQLKRERARAKREQELQSWKTSDHTEQEQEINKILTKLQNQIILRSDFNSLMNRDIFAELKKYRELYKDTEKLKNFNNYKSVSDWEKEKSDQLKTNAFYIRAINKKVLNDVAPVYKYELIDGVYKMNDNDPDKFWSSRCVNEF